MLVSSPAMLVCPLVLAVDVWKRRMPTHIQDIREDAAKSRLEEKLQKKTKKLQANMSFCYLSDQFSHLRSNWKV